MTHQWQSAEESKTYLGDGVYVTWNGYDFTLTTENGISVTNTIVLEPAVFLALKAFVQKAMA